MRGWIKLYRALLDKPIWLNSTPEQKTILITILLLANHEPNEWEWGGKKFTVSEGQFVTSLENLAVKCGKGITIQNVRTAIQRFEKLGFLTNESTKTGRVINIVNWELYQGDNYCSNKDTNSQLTKTQQSTNKELTPNKNDKEYKNDKECKNKESSRFTPPTQDQVREYCIERENSVDAERFIDFYSSKGWMVGKNKMKDWKAAVRNWERGNNNKGGNQDESHGRNAEEERAMAEHRREKGQWLIDNGYV